MASRGVRRPAGRLRFRPGATAARAAALPEHTLPTLPKQMQPPQQEHGTRPARALPYRPEASMQVAVAAAQVQLAMRCEGAAAVLQVYNRLELQAIPRRYTLAPGQPLQDHWAMDAERGYDLWLLGPNGFHRQWRGGSTTTPVQVKLQRDGATLRLTLHNASSSVQAVQVRAGAYEHAMPALQRSLQPGQSHEVAWQADASGGWYDLWVEHADVAQRLAGRAEDGLPGISDPAMGGTALLYQA
jgi:phospholipase C